MSAMPHESHTEDDEPSLSEAVAMHLWRTLPESVPIYLKLPGGATAGKDDDE